MSASEFAPERTRAIIEAILLASAEPVSPGKLLGALKGLNGRDIREAIDGLNERYEEGGHAIRVVEAAGGYQLNTVAEFAPWVRRFQDRGQVRLTQAGLETLAIVAFKQPVTRVEVDSIRGVDSAGVLRRLLEINMVRIVGRSEGLGRPMLFGTTKEFMVHFGLKGLADLPKPKELEELLAEGESRYGGGESGTAAEAAEAGADDSGAAVGVEGADDREDGDVAHSEATSNGGGPSVERSPSIGEGASGSGESPLMRILPTGDSTTRG